MKQSWCIPPDQSADFVCAMEDVLEVYQRPYDGNEALVCMDETSKQQVKETRAQRPAVPAAVATYDYEYERNGVSSLFMLFRATGWMAQGRGQRASHESGLGACDKATGR